MATPLSEEIESTNLRDLTYTQMYEWGARAAKLERQIDEMHQQLQNRDKQINRQHRELVKVKHHAIK